jgi:hypothetical protein
MNIKVTGLDNVDSVQLCLMFYVEGVKQPVIGHARFPYTLC